ncbi:unnamed protein product [Mytilus coruscus]|uniref:Uncharacterized protein n=1 Tax=Mytilus coruscus TaxID=42192 RepID=A0A6J8AXS5_MYTCO|nr:unnamed protein product [Mytilus coruscus]
MCSKYSCQTGHPTEEIPPYNTCYHRFIGFQDVNAVLSFNDNYKFKCCGFIYAWEIFVRENAAVPLNVKVQVWYDTGTIWNLREETIIEATADDTVKEELIPTGSRLRVFVNDRIGSYEYEGPVITYDNGGSYKIDTFTSDQTTFDWDAVATRNNRDHAIHARVNPSKAPTFTNLDDTVAISNNDVAGTVVFTLTTNDDDLEDAGLLTVAHTDSTGFAAAFFELDLNTLEVKIKAGVSLSPGDHSMTFTVADPCLKSTGILTIRIENDVSINLAFTASGPYLST